LKPTYELLKKTRQFIQAMPKLYKGWFSDGAGNYCTLGALQAVEKQDQNANLRQFGVAARNVLEKNLPAKFRDRGIAQYNDAFDTTREDIVALFTKAMRLAR
jgi:hypothetical protein